MSLEANDCHNLLKLKIKAQVCYFLLFLSVFLLKIKRDRDDKDADAEKFFTNSTEIKYVLKEIKKRNAFPRRVTMRASGTRYYFE